LKFGGGRRWGSYSLVLLLLELVGKKEKGLEEENKNKELKRKG
jgi:hypothetical protein